MTHKKIWNLAHRSNVLMYFCIGQNALTVFCSVINNIILMRQTQARGISKWAVSLESNLEIVSDKEKWNALWNSHFKKCKY